MSQLPAALGERLARIRLLILDVDGVLTDGTLYYGASGEATKAFNVRDGLGLRLLMQSGIELGVITARRGGALERRMADLGITHFYQGRDDKGAALDELLARLQLSPKDVAYVGDDLLDLPVLRRVGLALTVSNGHAQVRREADWVTAAAGGHGAVREIADALLDARGQLEQATSVLLGDHRATPTPEPTDFRVVIPARYAASRLPGKPLRLLAGRPMIAHVWDRAMESGASEVIVAADDERITQAIRELGGEAMMTQATHTSGTDRLAEVADRKGWPDHDIVVNLQGDEPCMPGELIRLVATALAERPAVGIATLATPIRRPADLFDCNVVKVVVNDEGIAAYFSRAPIPWVRDHFSSAAPPGGSLPEALPDGVRFLRHLGLYAYRVGTLRRISAAPVGAHEAAESLEQLRALALGIDLHVSIVDKPPGHGVDTEDDLARVEQELAAGHD